jgi:CMP-N-acetylneuraminic acid synthetase
VERIIISTNDIAFVEHCTEAEVVIEGEKCHKDYDADILWIKDLFDKVGHPHHFAVLRPTSPFRTALDIQKAWKHFQMYPYAESLRSVKPAPNPYKMWGQFQEYIYPAFHHTRINGQEIYNLPSQLAPQHYIQCGAIEIADVRNVLFRNNVSGQKIVPFYMDEINGFDINTEFDFQVAEMMVEKGMI